MAENKYLAWTAFALFLLSVGSILILVIASLIVSDYNENPRVFVFAIGAFSFVSAILGFLSFKIPQAKVGALGGLAILFLILLIIPIGKESSATINQPEITVQAQNKHTGIADIDNVIDTILAGNPKDVSQLLQFIKLACTHAEGLGGPPKCNDGETEGTIVNVFPFLGPEGHHMRYTNLDYWTGIPATGVFAGYRVSSQAYSDEFYPAGEYAIVFLTEQEELLVTVQVTNGNIVRVDNKFGDPPEINLERDASEIILAPNEYGSSNKPLTQKMQEMTIQIDPEEEQPKNQTSVSLVLINGILIDGTGSEPIFDAVVLIDGERIIAVGKGDQVSIPPNTPVIDVQGATILPGFINAHVHRSYDGETLEAWAQSGVTTVRDLGIIGNSGNQSDLFDFRDEVSKDPRYARLVVVGPMITVPGGYGSLPISSPEHARQTVNDLLDNGADLIKIGIEDNLQGRTWSMLSVDEIMAIVESTHTKDILVSAHVSRSKHLELALEAGVDDVAHMIVDDLSDKLVNQMIEDDVYWEPTLELWQCVRNLHDVKWDAKAIDNLKRFSQAGGKVALGTDYGGYRCNFDLGMPMIEVNLMLQADMTPMQIIVAATKNAAHVCNLENIIGTLEPGKIADILIVAENPLENIQTLKNVQMVIHNGVIIRE